MLSRTLPLSRKEDVVDVDAALAAEFDRDGDRYVFRQQRSPTLTPTLSLTSSTMTITPPPVAVVGTAFFFAVCIAIAVLGGVGPARDAAVFSVVFGAVVVAAVVAGVVVEGRRVAAAARRCLG